MQGAETGPAPALSLLHFIRIEESAAFIVDIEEQRRCTAGGRHLHVDLRKQGPANPQPDGIRKLAEDHTPGF